MTTFTIPVMKPVLPSLETVTPYLERVYESGIFSNHGPMIRELERRYAEWFNVSPESVVAIVNGTVAIAAASLWEDSPTYLIPEWTFPATAMGPLETGGRIEFRDVDPDSWTLSVSDSDHANRDSVVPVVVAPFGHPVDLEKWADFPRVIIDAAACAGNRPDLSGLRPGWAATVSLHATKVLGCGEGGLVIFGDPARAQIAREWINFGFSGSRVTERLGTNGKMSEIAGSFALAALDAAETEIAEWERVRGRAHDITTELGFNPGIVPRLSHVPYWLIACESAQRATQCEATLNESGIQTRRWWPAALTSTTPFASTPTTGNSNARFLAETVIALPMFRGLTEEHFHHIRSVLESCRA